jgi:hypothetical protein
MGLPPLQDLHSLVVRTDFSDDAAWEAVRQAIAAPQADLFQANVQFVDDRQYDGLTVAGLLDLVPAEGDLMFIFLVDREAIARPDHPVLVVDLFEDGRGRSLRVAPSAMWSIQNNLVIGNMDWEDFESSVDSDGVFRGFR